MKWQELDNLLPNLVIVFERSQNLKLKRRDSASLRRGYKGFVRTEYLEATLGLVKRLEISKELIRECVTVPGCCRCMPLLHHLMDSCSYVRKNTLLAAKGGYICTPLTPPKSATGNYSMSILDHSAFRPNTGAVLVIATFFIATCTF